MLTRVQWAQEYYDEAANAASGSNIFPLTLLTQAIIESQKQINGNWYPGQSQLAKLYNNYFGIKGTGSAGSVTLPTQEYLNGQWVTINDQFAKYYSITDSFRGYIEFLQGNPRYANQGVFSAVDYEQQLRRIAAAGYATNPNYANLLVNVADNLLDDLAEQIDIFTPGYSSSKILLPAAAFALLAYTLA